MKKYLILLGAAVGLTSCLLNVDDVFDESASQRIETAMNKYDELLRSNERGWLVEYWPEAGKIYGGYNLYFRFGDDGAVTVGSELLGDSLQTSHYSIKGDMGPTLNFDTYNSVFHYFSDPSLNVGGGTGYSYEGDYEFVLLSGDESEVVIKGKKTHNIMGMTPLPEGTTWPEYVEQIEYIVANGRSPEYMMVVVGEEYEMTSSSRVFTIFDGDREVVAPYIYTPHGLRFYEPVTVAGREYQDFTLDVSAQIYHSSDGTASIYMIFPPMNEVFLRTKTWKFILYSQTLVDIWSEAFNKFYAASGYWPYIVYFGECKVERFEGVGVYFLCSNLINYYYAGYTLEFTPVPDSEDLIEVTYNGSMFGYGNVVACWMYLSPLAQHLSDNSPYSLIPNDVMNVTSMWFVSTVDPDVYFEVQIQ